MDNKKWNADEFFGARELNPDDLDGIAGGVTLEDLTPEEQEYYKELYEASKNCSSADWETKKELWNRVCAFMDEMIRKYGNCKF